MKDQFENLFLERIDLRSFCKNGFQFKINNVELSVREIQCMAGWMLGLTAKQMSMLLCLSHRTVESHLDRLKTKLKCKHRSQIIILAFAHHFPVHLCFNSFIDHS